MDNSAMSLDSSSPYYVDPVNYEMDDWYSFYNNYGRDHSDHGWVDADPDGLIARINDFFLGTRSSAMTEYNRQKELKDRAFQEAQQNSARRFQEYLESSKYQRTSEDLKAAGLNPWLAIQSNLGQANVSSSPAVQRHSARYLEKSDNKSGMNAFTNIITTAIRVAALIALS